MIKSQWNPEIQGRNIEGQLENQRKTLEAQGRKISALEAKLARSKLEKAETEYRPTTSPRGNTSTVAPRRLS